MLLTDYTYYQGDSAITAMYQGDVKVYPLEPPVTNNKIYYTSTDGNIVDVLSMSFDANIISNTYGSEGGVIIFDRTVTSIGNNAFDYCETLSSVMIPDSITSIGNGAFNKCSSLSGITIPDSVTSIGEFVFSECLALSNITYTGTMAQWTQITKGTNWNQNVPATVVHCSDGDVPI